MSIAVTSYSRLAVVETFAGVYVNPGDATVTVDGLSEESTLSASTTPPVTKHSHGQKALSAGSATIDLTSLPDISGTAGAVTFNGLKVQRAIFENPITNANAITVTVGGSDGYLLGGAAWKYILQPGSRIHIENVDTAPDVASNAKNIDITGTGSQELNFHLVAG